MEDVRSDRMMDDEVTLNQSGGSYSGKNRLTISVEVFSPVFPFPALIAGASVFPGTQADCELFLLRLD